MKKVNAIILMVKPTRMALAKYFNITRMAVSKWSDDEIPGKKELHIRKDINNLAKSRGITIKEATGLCNDEPPTSNKMKERLIEVKL